MPGYSGKPLAAKLGIKEGLEIFLDGAPEDYSDWLAPMPPDVKIARGLSKNVDLVHVFATRKAALAAALKKYRRDIKPDAAVWVSWPKKASKQPTDITEDVIRETALPLGFVDIKVCAVTEVWSGLKLVIRKELRSATR